MAVEMLEDSGDDAGVGDDGNDAQFALATRAAAEVDVEHTLEPSHPLHWRAGRFVIGGFVGPGACRARFDDETALRGIGCKQSVIPQQMRSSLARHRAVEREPIARDYERFGHGGASQHRLMHAHGGSSGLRAGGDDITDGRAGQLFLG